jgi:hypothetical protein
VDDAADELAFTGDVDAGDEGTQDLTLRGFVGEGEGDIDAVHLL